MFNWVKKIFSKKEETKAETVSTVPTVKKTRKPVIQKTVGAKRGRPKKSEATA